MSGEKRIKVACRVRPKMERMGERYELEVAKKADEHTLIITQPAEDANDKPKQHVYSFDYVFDDSDTQRDIYEESALELVDSCLDGCNSTIFTYGQTGSGKTFTVLGDVDEKSETLIKPSSGLFLRSLTDLFNYKERSRRAVDCRITLSILEIYNEELRDLLAKKTKVQMREIDEEVQLPNLTTVEVNTLTDVYKYFKIANAERAVTATNMNAESSRSHAVFLVDLYQTPRQSTDHNPLADGVGAVPVDTPNPKGMKWSRLSLVDLAGSERVKKSGVEGKGMLEAQAINKSLSCLGNVVNAMYLDTKHIPYRDSKLTRLLRTSFVDPSSKVMLITNLSPTASSFAESLSSLRFADRVKGLKAGNVSALDPVAEQEYLSRLKQAEELSADLRIAQAAAEYRPQRPRKKWSGTPGGDIKQYLKQCIAEYQQQVNQEEEQRRRKEEEELQRMIQSETIQVVEAWKRRTVDMETSLADADREMALLRHEVATVKETKEKEIEDKMNEAKRRKKERKIAEEVRTVGGRWLVGWYFGRLVGLK
eukprot:TRINITY_DN3858_c0_g1_i1.p1 TRINITY_DN3858_c0_g1~~TRINITY_DN3858_c0_g1_i1.p1  ORF type:complete len:537 (+),score=149.99 TRINITY_DN3858_c0_g1_i1:33-1643(+)